MGPVGVKQHSTKEGTANATRGARVTVPSTGNLGGKPQTRQDQDRVASSVPVFLGLLSFRVIS